MKYLKNSIIKARVWDTEDKKMYFIGEGDLGSLAWDLDNLGYNTSSYYNYIDMLYTGLKDKNGKEIYEGDIVRNKRHNFKTVIEYYGASFRCKSEGLPLSMYIDDLLVDEKNQIEVIGNIYENPELLQGIDN
jgi:uncharacterized phage protein (TIGR01671 family)